MTGNGFAETDLRLWLNLIRRLGLGKVVRKDSQDDAQTERTQCLGLHRENLSLHQSSKYRFNAFSQSRVAAWPATQCRTGY